MHLLSVRRRKSKEHTLWVDWDVKCACWVITRPDWYTFDTYRPNGWNDLENLLNIVIVGKGIEWARLPENRGEVSEDNCSFTRLDWTVLWSEYTRFVISMSETESVTKGRWCWMCMIVSGRSRACGRSGYRSYGGRDCGGGNCAWFEQGEGIQRRR